MAGAAGTKHSKERPGALIFEDHACSPNPPPSYAELLYEMYTQTQTTVTHCDTDTYVSPYHLLFLARSICVLGLRS